MRDFLIDDPRVQQDSIHWLLFQAEIFEREVASIDQPHDLHENYRSETTELLSLYCNSRSYQAERRQLGFEKQDSARIAGTRRLGCPQTLACLAVASIA